MSTEPSSNGILYSTVNSDDERHGFRSNCSASSATSPRSYCPTQPGTEKTWQNNKRWKTSSGTPSFPSDLLEPTTNTTKQLQPVEQMELGGAAAVNETELGNGHKRPIKNALNEEAPFPVSPLPRSTSDEELHPKVPKVQQQHCDMLQESQPEWAIKKKFHKLPAHAEFLTDDLTEPRKLKTREGRNTGECGEEAAMEVVIIRRRCDKRVVKGRNS